VRQAVTGILLGAWFAAAAAGGCGTIEAEDPGIGDDDSTPPTTDQDGDGFAAGYDCNDFDAGVNPQAAEVCDGADQNCNGIVDEGFDEDLDGFTPCTGDCDDLDAGANPDAAEVCDAEDNDCDGAVDDGLDADGDGLSPCQGDCDDAAADVLPGADETCDCADQDCDGAVDEGEVCGGGATFSCDGVLFGDWGIYSWWAFDPGLSGIDYFQMGLSFTATETSASGDFVVYWLNASFATVCTEEFTFTATNGAASECPDCTGAIRLSTLTGPVATDCAWVGYPTWTAADFRSVFGAWYYSDVIDPTYDLGDGTLSGEVRDQIEAQGVMVVYEVYLDFGSGEYTPSGFVYR